MKPCPYCRSRPGVLRVGATGSGGVFASWACEPCQVAVDLALAGLARALEGR